MAELSPQAQAVWNAFLNHSEWEVTSSELTGLAAALRAVSNDWRVDTEFIDGVEYIRTNTLDALAAELEGKAND